MPLGGPNFILSLKPRYLSSIISGYRGGGGGTGNQVSLGVGDENFRIKQNLSQDLCLAF